ncbi:hypothetical protein L1281_000267 [Neisseria sp. HSC-16F19]|nr:SNF2-related protein [Neisseria sp. HSC-16F19]MCP2039697.1 hypothetical protein [Neisseria sp. HSC-16F19]
MNTTPHQAKYAALELLCRQSGDDVARLSQSLFDARVDLNPHQIDAALFALKNPLQEGVLLADEVGLGKTVEAGLVLCQLWAERKRRLLVVCPASLRKQWAQELGDKFALPAQVVDKSLLKAYGGQLAAYVQAHSGRQVLVMSYPFAARQADALAAEMWDCITLDEAHKLRNAHKSSNKIGQALRQAFAGRKKLLLSATPLQNSLMELYGLSTLMDEYLFGDEKEFRKQFVGQNNIAELQSRLQGFVKRTLRKDVLEYIRYTRRHTLTQRFSPTDAEHALYEAVSAFLQREESFALPRRQRHLTGLLLRKLLASSPYALTDTLTIILRRLEALQQQPSPAPLQTDWLDTWAQDLDLAADDEDEWEAHDDDATAPDMAPKADAAALQAEIDDIRRFIAQAQALQTDSKAQALLQALETGFAKMADLGAPQKCIVFTESLRTQQFLFEFLSRHGYQNQITLFSGSNNSPEAQEIYRQWLQEHQGSERVTGSAAVDKRTALIDHFRHHSQIMLATEAAAEGVNLQFCALMVNYDLPWNPQRIEQRIGRCHRYGQAFDVVVINFLNERNEADRRVLELLSDKFKLFDGVFGASDEILGRIESGLDFEKRIAAIYDGCRNSADIEAAFNRLQQELEQEIQAALEKTGHQLLDHFDEDVHERLKLQLQQGETRLDSIGRWFWQATRYALQAHADFDDEHKRFHLHRAPAAELHPGHYRLVRQQSASALTETAQEYRIGHPLGQWCLKTCQQAATPPQTITFDYSRHAVKISVLAGLVGHSGWLRLDKLAFRSASEEHEQLLFTACTDQGQWLDEDCCRKLLGLAAVSGSLNGEIPALLADNAAQAVNAATAKQADRQHQLLAAESERLDKWAQDKIQAAERAIEETGAQLNQAKREKRHAAHLAEQAEWEQKIKQLEMKRRRQRQQIFDVEEAIEAQRDALIASIDAKLKQQSHHEYVWTIRWQVV